MPLNQTGCRFSEQLCRDMIIWAEYQGGCVSSYKVHHGHFIHVLLALCALGNSSILWKSVTCHRHTSWRYTVAIIVHMNCHYVWSFQKQAITAYLRSSSDLRPSFMQQKLYILYIYFTQPNMNKYSENAKSCKALVEKSGGKWWIVAKSGEKFGKMGKKWRKVANSG